MAYICPSKPLPWVAVPLSEENEMHIGVFHNLGIEDIHRKFVACDTAMSMGEGGPEVVFVMAGKFHSAQTPPR